MLRQPGTAKSEEAMSKTLVIILALVLTACASGAGSAAPTAATALPASASGLCIDRALLADDAQTVGPALQGIAGAVKGGNGEQARSLATGAVAGMRKLADLVEPAQPDAAKGFRTAADTLAGAAPSFPDGATAVEDVQTAFEAAYELARTVACPG
jgi:cytochrome c551/c552